MATSASTTSPMSTRGSINHCSCTPSTAATSSCANTPASMSARPPVRLHECNTVADAGTQGFVTAGEVRPSRVPGLGRRRGHRHVQPHEAGNAHSVPDRADDRVQGIPRSCGGGRRLLVPFVDDREEELFPGTEVVEDSRVGEPDALGDPPQRRLPVALGFEDVEGGLEDLRPAGHSLGVGLPRLAAPDDRLRTRHRMNAPNRTSPPTVRLPFTRMRRLPEA